MLERDQETMRREEDQKAIAFRRIQSETSWEDQERAVYTTDAMRRDFEVHLAGRTPDRSSRDD